MAKLAISLLITAAACCFVEGATPGDFHKAINIQSNLVRAEAFQEIREAASRSEGAARCVALAISPSYGEVNRALALRANQLRAEAVAWLGSLTSVTDQQLEASVRDRLWEDVRPVVTRTLAGINAC